MTKEEYLDNRVEHQIAWYDNKSRVNQIWFKIFRIVEVVAAAFIPFLSCISSKYAILPYVIGFLGIVIAVSTALSSLYKCQENWIQYRTTAEQLKHEKFLFKTGAGIYDSQNSYLTFVYRIECLISRENSLWAQQVKKIDQVPKEISP